jgi:hypothetical protein
LIETVTDSRGFYRFTGLAPGIYSIFEVHPDQYFDGVDTPGSTGGFAANPLTEPVPFLLDIEHNDDAIVRVSVGAGGRSVENNFSELETAPPPPPLPPFIPPPTQLPPLPAPPASALGVPIAAAPIFVSAQPQVITQSYFGGATYRAPGYSWHLSVVDGGQPRNHMPGEASLMPVANSRSDTFSAMAHRMQQAGWKLLVDGQVRDVVFGAAGSVPIAGDFNGDGLTEIGVFLDGQWFIDLNGNGVWDDGDLWAELGSRRDKPVVGDWDGDGKADIGIFGPSWPSDARAVSREPGLPDPENEPKDAYKNVPPKPADAAGWRKLKRTARGRLRADLVDHVFFFGTGKDVPVAGDFNGDGVATLGVFHRGLWVLDDNGDGQWLPGETLCEFGQPGDIPVVGDFDGNGVDQIAVYRDGVWFIDTNGNRRLDESDEVLQLGAPGDVPIVGDWDGDGRDDPGVYHDPAPRGES